MSELTSVESLVPAKKVSPAVELLLSSSGRSWYGIPVREETRKRLMSLGDDPPVLTMLCAFRLPPETQAGLPPNMAAVTWVAAPGVAWIGAVEGFTTYARIRCWSSRAN